MAYTVRLIAIKCLAAQKEDGDEIHVRFNGVTIWSIGRSRMHARPHDENQVSEFDFEGGRKHTPGGWRMITPYDPYMYIFGDQVGESAFELWETDLLARENCLGTTPVSIRDNGHGKISTAFRKNGAHYLLTYQVTSES